MRTKKQLSSQYVFDYQKRILFPAQYTMDKSGKVEVKLPEVVGKGYGTFWRWKGRYRAVKGSRASKKSKTTALWYITNMMRYPDANTLVVRKTYRTLKDSCFTELKWAIHRLGVDAFWDIKESPLEMTYKPTGQKIYFRGLDDPLKVTSITVDQGVLCWMWIEEAYEISSEDDFNMLDESIRGAIPEGSDLFKQITVTFNPCPGDWLYNRLGNLAARVTSILVGDEKQNAGNILPDTDAVWYRVRKTWSDSKGQIGAYHDLTNAKALADKNPGYYVFDESGVAIYPGQTFAPYMVNVKVNDLQIRTAPSVDARSTGSTGKGSFTIIEEKTGKISKKGATGTWGHLKAYAHDPNNGWICLAYKSYTEKL